VVDYGDLPEIKALVFDVIGTCTDYWSAIIREGEKINRTKGLNLDWRSIAKDWHGLFPSTFAAVKNGQRPWESFGALRLDALEEVMRERGLTSLSREELADFNLLWQRLDPWADVIPGLQRLKKKFTLATLSNIDMADMVKLSKHGGLPWDLVLTSELAHAIKPDRRVYQLAPEYLGLKPAEIMMVACHKQDLQGAQVQGLRTAFVARPLEAGPGGQVDSKPDAQFGINCVSFVELANLLQA
jgi:2-haloacid dehalogenase